MSSDDSLLFSKNAAASGYLEISEANFMQEVLEGSLKTPFLLQFFTQDDPNSQKSLPILEKITKDFEGTLRFGRLDVFKNRALCQQLAQSGLPLTAVPLTVLFVQGKIIDLFQGFQSAEFLRDFIESSLKKAGISPPSTHLLDKANKALEDNKPEEACAYFGEMIEKNSDSPEGWSGLLRALIAMNEIEAAQEALADLPPNLLEHPDIKGAKAAILFAAKKGEALSELENLEKEAALSPENTELQCRLADSLNAAGEAEKAADLLLGLIADKSKKESAEQAKQKLLYLFEAWGENDLTRAYRRKLSSLLFA